jgi:hypothetical protein
LKGKGKRKVRKRKRQDGRTEKEKSVRAAWKERRVKGLEERRLKGALKERRGQDWTKGILDGEGGEGYRYGTYYISDIGKLYYMWYIYIYRRYNIYTLKFV